MTRTSILGAHKSQPGAFVLGVGEVVLVEREVHRGANSLPAQFFTAQLGTLDSYLSGFEPGCRSHRLQFAQRRDIVEADPHTDALEL